MIMALIEQPSRPSSPPSLQYCGGHPVLAPPPDLFQKGKPRDVLQRNSAGAEIVAELQDPQAWHSGNLPVVRQEGGTAGGQCGGNLDRVGRFQANSCPAG